MRLRRGKLLPLTPQRKFRESFLYHNRWMRANGRNLLPPVVCEDRRRQRRLRSRLNRLLQRLSERA